MAYESGLVNGSVHGANRTSLSSQGSMEAPSLGSPEVSCSNYHPRCVLSLPALLEHPVVVIFGVLGILLESEPEGAA